jgi:predicted permease
LGRQRLRSSLVVAEVALALVLLVGAGLFLRSLAALQDVQPGFQSSGVITARLTLPRGPYGDNDKQIAFFRTALGNLSSMPGVTSAAAATNVPFDGNGGSASFSIEGRPSPPGDPGPHGGVGMVSPEYFALMKIPIRKGRTFSDADRKDSQPVAVIDEILARQYWPNEEPLGKHIRFGSGLPWSTIVGVVAHVREADLAGEEVKGKYYFPLYQIPQRSATLVARTPGDPALLTATIREAVRAVDPSQPVAQITLLPDMVNNSLGARRFVMSVLGVFAGMALLMAVVGLYGVISYAVTQRTQEMGVRMALGAQPGEILRMVLGQGMRLACGGAAIGLVVSLISSRLLQNQLYRVSPFDPLTFAVMAGVLIGAAVVASCIPALRATRVDPMVALRYE